jgi:hypothetical protein
MVIATKPTEGFAAAVGEQRANIATIAQALGITLRQ